MVAQKPVSVAPENSTCGLRSITEFCIQTHGIYRECDYCDGTERNRSHGPEYLTDIHEESNSTW